MSEQNKAVVRRYFQELLNGARADVVDEIMTQDCVFTAPVLAAAIRGSDTLKQVFSSLHATFPDLHFDVHEEFAEGDRVATSWTMRGTHQGEWLGVPATGRTLSITGFDIFHCRDGRICRVAIQADYLGAMRQLGAVAAGPAV